MSSIVPETMSLHVSVVSASSVAGEDEVETLPVFSATPFVSSPVADFQKEIAGEEVILNRRGMPARQRKKNKLYFDEEVMVMDPFNKRGQHNKSLANRSVSPNPLDYDYEDVKITEDILDFVTGEIEIPSVFEEEVVTTSAPVVRKPGRPKKSSTLVSSMPPPNLATTRKKSSKTSHTSTSNPFHKTREEAAKERGRTERMPHKISRSQDSGHRAGKTSDKSGGKGSRVLLNKDESRNKSCEASSMNTAAKIKKEAMMSGSMERMDQRYIEKREKDRLAKERERERKKEQQLKEREREYNSLLPLKSRGYREPPNDFTSAILSAAMDDFEKKIDERKVRDLGLRLRNLLKLPKAHKYVYCEWFYSNIDKALFEGENDFQVCLRESFPLLKAKKLTRVEWCKIRRIMGKPRRCSENFFTEERKELGCRRQKVRMIQQRKLTNFHYKELPDEIPLLLTIGTKVTARLRSPQDGLFTGTIEGVDTSNNSYRITFDRIGLRTHSIPDYEVLSNEPVETVSTSVYALKIPRRNSGFVTAAKFRNPGLIGVDGLYRFPTSPFPAEGMLGGFPIRLLEMILRFSKLLTAKRQQILQFKQLNVESEKMISYGKPFTSYYRLRYARCVMDLMSMNKDMAMHGEGIQAYFFEQIAPYHGANQMIIPVQVQDQCKQEAALIVESYNTRNGRRAVQGPKAIGFISNLTSLMLQIKKLSVGERNPYELKSLQETIKETKASLYGKNLQLFENLVEIPMNRIQAGFCIYSKRF